MSEDIHKWTRGRYTLMFDEHTFFVFDNEKEERMTALNVTKKLNELSEENEQLQKDLYIVQTDCKNAKESKEHWRNKAKELEEKNKQIGFLKRDLYTIIRDTKETPFGNSITMTKIRERWE